VLVKDEEYINGINAHDDRYGYPYVGTPNYLYDEPPSKKYSEISLPGSHSNGPHTILLLVPLA
jgi:hypothetical protein